MSVKQDTFRGNARQTTQRKARISDINFDGLFSPSNRPLLVGAIERYLALPPEEAFRLIVATESEGRQVDPKTGRTITSSAGAKGIAQVMPETAKQFAPIAFGAPLDEARYKNDADYNYRLGYAVWLDYRNKFGGNNVHASQAYNIGPGSSRERSGHTGNIIRSGLDLRGLPASGRDTAEAMANMIQTIKNDENFKYVLTTLVRADYIPVASLSNEAFKSGAQHYARAPFTNREGRTDVALASSGRLNSAQFSQLYGSRTAAKLMGGTAYTAADIDPGLTAGQVDSGLTAQDIMPGQRGKLASADIEATRAIQTAQLSAGIKPSSTMTAAQLAQRDEAPAPRPA